MKGCGTGKKGMSSSRGVAREPVVEGDRVMLVSGGPFMTVDNVCAGRLADVVWFDSHDRLKKACFSTLALVKVPVEKSEEEVE